MTAHNQPGKPAAHRVIIVNQANLRAFTVTQVRHCGVLMSMAASSSSAFYLLRVPVAQHKVGSFDVCVDVLVLMDVLQYCHLRVKHQA